MSPTISQRTGPLRTVLAHRAAVGRTADGELRVFTVSQGTDAPLSVLDASGTSVAEVPLPGAGGAWALDARVDGSCVIGTYFDGSLYEWDGRQLSALGRPTEQTTYVWDVVALPDGTTLAATYPDASVVAHHRDTGTRVLRSFGSEEILYARSICVDLERRMVWCGLGVTPCRVVGFPLDDPDATTVELSGLPDHLVPSQLVHLGDRIWIRAGSELWSFDPQDPVAERVAGTEATLGGYLSPEHRGRTWTTSGDGGLFEIDLAQRRVVRTVPLGLEGGLLGASVDDGVLTGLFGYQRPALVRIDLDEQRTLSSTVAEVAAVPSHMGDLIAVPDTDDFMLSAGQQGDILRWSRTSDELSAPVTIGQVESWAWSNDGLLHAGTYPYARLVEVDPQRLDQPRVLADLRDSHRQSRPIAVHPGRGAVWMGTTPGYGLRDGALTRVDPATGEVTVTMMADETVHAIADDGTALLVGTSPEAGTGAPVHDGTGRLLRIDPETLQVLAERPAPALSSSGGARTLAAITRFAERWWLVADHAVWQFDPQTLEAEHVADLGAGPSARASFHPDGDRLVVLVDGEVWTLDTERNVARISEGCHKLAVVDGEVWGIVRPEGGTVLTDLRRIRPQQA